VKGNHLTATLAAVALLATAVAVATAAAATRTPPSPAPSAATPLTVGQPDAAEHAGPAAQPSQAAQAGQATPAGEVGAAFYGCYGQTDYPHLSSHNPGYVNVEARTWCAVWMPWLYVKTDLYRSRWWGWEWLAWGSRGGSGYRVDDHAARWCGGTGTFTYLGSSYHEAQINGQYGIVYTWNANRFGC
jgi:hypothetical protein